MEKQQIVPKKVKFMSDFNALLLYDTMSKRNIDFVHEIQSHYYFLYSFSIFAFYTA